MTNKNWQLPVKRKWSSFASRLKAIRVLISLFLLPLLTACGNTQTVYVPVQPVPISADLTADTVVPNIPDPLTFGASLDLNVALLTALGQCNMDKTAIRKIEQQRASK